MKTALRGRHLLLAAAILLLPAQAAVAQFVCFPTCSTTDAKFVAVAGAGAFTFTEDAARIQVSAPGTATSLTIGIFDGDTGGAWDSGTTTLDFQIDADPDADSSGSGGTVLAFNGGTLADDGWSDFVIDLTTTPQALSDGGNYYFVLSAETTDPLAVYTSSFKVRTNGFIGVSGDLALQPQVVNILAPLFAPRDLDVIYPAFPTLTPTGYDGVWDFFVGLETSATEFVIWDGDFDRGSSDCTSLDTDDPDTSNTVLPPWASAVDTNPEGVAIGDGPPTNPCPTTGQPPDDSDQPVFARSPSLFYTVTDPLGNVYTNNNPSGNQEWEQFRLLFDGSCDSSVTCDPDTSSTCADVCTASLLPPGIYRVRIEGLDIGNLDSLRFLHTTICHADTGDGSIAPCDPPPAPFLVGDTVWLDTDGNGVQDGAEAGIEDVFVELVDMNGFVLDSMTTDSNGNYSFSVVPGEYTVRISADNFDPGEVLEGFFSTTGGETQTNTVVDQNVLTYDFGYVGPGSIGDRVWRDDDGDGVQDAGEPGLNGVMVRLRDSSGAVIDTQTTTGDGNYSFDDLPPGDYTVEVVTATLPGGVDPTFDLDGVGTPHTTAVTLDPGENRTDVDFGYQGLGSIGDRVWRDDDGDGDQDAGEPGLNGVTVRLLDGGGNVIATDVTSGDGDYLFPNLPAGSYTVEVDPSSLPGGVAPTFDFDGVGTPNTADVALGPAQNQTLVDFGYQGTGSIGDRVWRDDDADGVQDGGEAGINGVTVRLLDSGGNVIDTDVTAGDGEYLFDNLPEGDYTVEIAFTTLPAGLVPTFDFDGIGTMNTADVSLGAGENQLGVDFGYDEDDTDSICLPTIDFETDSHGDSLKRGDIIDNEWSSIGVHVTTNDPVNHPAMIFNSANPTGGDYDLGTPNQDFGGPGIGSGGQAGQAGENSDALGKILIISEDGDQNDPDDNYAGGTLIFTFDQEVFIDSVQIVDIDGNEAMGTVKTFDAGGALLTSTMMAPLGNNSEQVVSVGAQDVRRLEVFFPKSGALANIVFCPGEENEYCVTEAPVDSNVHGGNGNHAVWLPGISTDLVFSPPGTFVENPDGTASLSGTVVDLNDPALRFEVNVTFAGRTDVAPAGSPKKELLASAYSDNGGPVDPSTWHYYTSFTGTLTGQGDMAGAVIDIERTGPAFQVGEGANNKNLIFGASGWFTWTVISQPHYGYCVPSGTGDFNIELKTDCPTDPQTPCDDCDHYEGSLWDPGDYDLQPNGTYYYAAKGRHEGWLEGPADADFDLYLYKWNGSSWSRVASSTSYSSSEHISYDGGAGYYTWMVYDYSGSGDYELWLSTP